MEIVLLYVVQVRRITTKRVEITLVPNWLGRWLRRSRRVGDAVQGMGRDFDSLSGRSVGPWKVTWFWKATRRFVGNHIERYIEAAPQVAIEDMSVEQLLGDGK